MIRTLHRRSAGLGPWRLKTMDLYVARVFFLSWIACTVSFIGLFVVIEAFAKLDRFLKHEGGFFDTMFRYYGAMVPTIYTNYMGPILTSAAALFTMTLLNRHNEVQALKSAGVSVYRILAPIFVFAALFVGLTFWLQEVVLPNNRDSIRSALAISKSKPLEPEAYYDSENGLHIQVGQYSTTRRVGSIVKVSQRHQVNDKAKMQIDANQMEWVPDSPGNEEHGHWLLHDGSIQRWDEGGNLVVNSSAKNFERLKEFFPEMNLETTLRPIDLETSNKDISYLSWSQLRAQFRRQDYHRHLAVKLHHHFAFPMAHVLLLFLGLPFVLKLQNRSVFLGMAAAILIGASFYLVSSVCASIAIEGNYFSPTFAAWLPIMLFGALGFTLFDRMPS
jgi:lipopolysaccharide export system permease protein